MNNDSALTQEMAITEHVQQLPIAASL